MAKSHKSFPARPSPALRHISDLIRLRAVPDLLPSSQVEQPRAGQESWLQRANNSFKPSPLRGLVVSDVRRQRAGLTQALAGARVGFCTLSSVTKPRIKGISCAVHFCQEQTPSSLARAACRSGPSATRIGSGCNRTKSDQRLASQLTIRSSRRRFAASW